MTAYPQEVTQLLLEMSDGNQDAMDRLMPMVYDELHALAHYKLRFERADHTFNTTGLVHEAYLRLVDQRRVQWKNRTHFFAIAAQAMRRILINYAAKQKAEKRGGGAPKLALDEAPGEALVSFSMEQADELLVLNDLLTRLEAFNERGCRVVEYRFFGGMTYEEIAELMDLSPITVRRAWNAARAWLRREMQAG